MDKTNLTIYPSDGSDDRPTLKEPALDQLQAVQEGNEPAEAQNKPLPPEMRLFIADLREFFREVKQFVVFLRNKRNTNALLVALTFALAIAAFTQALIYGLQLKPLRDSADAAKNSADTATRQLELTQRPWVFVSDAKVASPLTFDKDGAHITFEITVRNSGPTPAVNIEIQPRLEPFTGRHQPCDATNYNIGQMKFMSGIMLFPNTESPRQLITFGLGKEEIEKNTRRIPNGEAGVLAIEPFICVLYRPTFRNDGPGYSSEIKYSFWSILSPHRPSITSDSLPLEDNGFFGEEAH